MKKLIFLFLFIICFQEVNAYFFADRVVFSNPLFTSGAITYYTGATAINVRTSTWNIIFASLNIWALTTDTSLITSATPQQASQVHAEWLLWADCTISSYNSAARTATWFFCPAGRLFFDNISILWSKWETGSTWPQGIQGIQGIQGMTWSTWLSAYEIAQWWWFTWSEVEWIASIRWQQGATGTIDFSTITGAINLQNVVNIPTQNAELDENGFYFAITREKDGITYIDWVWVRNLAVVIVFVLILWKIFRFITSNDRKLFN